MRTEKMKDLIYNKIPELVNYHLITEEIYKENVETLKNKLKNQLLKENKFVENVVIYGYLKFVDYNLVKEYEFSEIWEAWNEYMDTRNTGPFELHKIFKNLMKNKTLDKDTKERLTRVYYKDKQVNTIDR